MRVADLIALLQQHHPRAEVVLPDRSSTDERGLLPLRAEEIRVVQVGHGEANGVAWVERWNARDATLSGPSTAVLLGD